MKKRNQVFSGVTGTVKFHSQNMSFDWLFLKQVKIPLRNSDAFTNAKGQRTLSYASRWTPCSFVNGRQGVIIGKSKIASKNMKILSAFIE